MNIKKYKGIGAYKAIRHDLDIKTRSNEQHIDTSIENIYIAGETNYDAAIKKYNNILNSIDTKKSDSVTLGSIICTLPKDFNGDAKSFFVDITKALTEKVGGKENVLYAVVHIDEPESQPHLEFKFCPVINGVDKRCKNKNKILKKFCWDKLCDRNFYKNLHKDIQKKVGEEYNCTLVNDLTINDIKREARKIAISSGKEEDWQNYYKTGNKSIKQLKSETEKALVELQKELKNIQNLIFESQNEYSKLIDERAELTKKGITNFLTKDIPTKTYDTPIFSIYEEIEDITDTTDEFDSDKK